MLNLDLAIDSRIKQLVSRLEKLNVKELVDPGLEEYARQAEAGAKTLAPKDTGHMASMIGVRKISDAYYEIYSVVRAPEPYNIYVHEGTSKMQKRPFLKWGVAWADLLFNPESRLSEELQKRIDQYLQ